MNLGGILTIILAVALALFTVWVVRTMPKFPPVPVKVDDLGAMLRRTAEDAEIPFDVFVKLLESESGLDPTAKSDPNPNGSTDHGIAQLNGYYLQWFGEKYLGAGPVDPYDVPRALTVAARYLRDLADLFGGCWACAVGAYKRGPVGWAEVLKRGGPGHAHESIAGEHTCRSAK